MDIDLAALLLRIGLGAVFLMHGWNHGFGSGGLQGTADWFESIGLRPAALHARISTYVEIAAGVALLVGLLTPLVGAACVGIMATAFITVHRANGFFIFRDGYEYVLVIVVAATALVAIGPGVWSLDRLLGIQLSGWEYAVAALLVGTLAAVTMVAACRRPQRRAASPG